MGTNVCFAQKHAPASFTIAFYNVENLFDTIDNPQKNDEEFTPRGRLKYTEEVYKQKINNLAHVINNLPGGTNNSPAIIGLAEIENDNALKDLLNDPQLKEKQYRYILYESPDIRGVDVAMLYDPSVFQVCNTRSIPILLDIESTRDLLFVSGILFNDTVHILVNHWPSRRGGVSETIDKRIAAAMVNRKVIDSLLNINSSSKIIVMGDFNDNPTSESVVDVLKTSGETSKLSSKVLYNPWLSKYRAGLGTAAYNDHWDLFDQVLLSKQCLKNKAWKFDKAEIYAPQFLIQQSGKYKGYPLRSFSGTRWMNGYSDHLPVFLSFHLSH